jgi:hypothetical protein
MSEDFLTQFLPRLTSELNVTSLILLMWSVTLWFAYLRLLNRYVNHLEGRVDEMARDRLYLNPPPSSSPASTVLGKGAASRYQSPVISESSLIEGLTPNAA